MIKTRTFDDILTQGTLRECKRIRLLIQKNVNILDFPITLKKVINKRIKELQLDNLQRLVRNKTDDTIITSRHGKRQAYAPVLKIEKFMKVETPRKGFKEFKRVMI